MKSQTTEQKTQSQTPITEKGLAEMRLQRLVKAAEKAQQEVAQSFQGPAANGLNALSWMGEAAADLALGALAYGTLADAARRGFVVALGFTVGEATGRLLRNTHRPSSTSAFHNAVELAMAEADSRFVDLFEGALARVEAEETATGQAPAPKA